MQGRVKNKVIEKEMRTSYLDYAMSVIVGRALPDVRDGLKPVHRRILYAMHKMGMTHDKPHKKSARIVGEVLGKYHPHGDTAVYDTLVRMAQDFSLRYPMIDGHGNFGSIDGDSPAAMRYTEARMAQIAEEMLEDIEKDTVNFQPNFDTSLEEPVVLPSKIPDLLINGSSGIAVGMATNIPPHNLNEVASAVIAKIDNPNITIKELMKYIKGPDFPTGGIIVGRAGIYNAYKKAKGRITVRAKTEPEEVRGKQAIIVNEIPYMVNKSMLIEKIAECVKTDRVEGISDLRDESDREGMRIVIELKRNANYDVVLNQLYKHTRMQTTFGANMLALVGNQPRYLNLKETLQYFIDHRKEVVVRRTKYDLQKAENRAHILEGLTVALNNIDRVIKIVKESSDADSAQESLMELFDLSEKQAKSILRMRLQRLTALEQDKIKEERIELLKKIDELRSILSSEQKVYSIIKDELNDVIEKYGDERRTEIIDAQGEIVAEDLIKEEQMVITISHSGYIKRTPPAVYRQQRRGGKGIIATKTKDEDFVEHIFLANTHSYLLFFTDKGKVYWLKVYRVPEMSRQAKGKAIVNLLRLSKEENITAVIPIREFEEDKYLVMATRKGIVNKTSLSAYSNPRKGGIIGINLEGDNELIDVVMTDGTKNIMLATRKGYAIRFNEQDVRPTGRATIGVKGINLRKGDYVVGMVVSSKEKTLLTITEKGYGKRTPMTRYRLINRGGKGVINIKCTPKNGEVVDVKAVKDDDELMLISKEGILIRVPVKGISTIGRNTQGVRVMRLNKGDAVIGTAKINE